MPQRRALRRPRPRLRAPAPALAALAVVLAVVGLGALAPGARAAAASAAATPAPTPDATAAWLPGDPDASWTYRWTDSVYAPSPTLEHYAVVSHKARSFTLGWTTDDPQNGSDSVAGAGTIDMTRTSRGARAVSWSATPPPPDFPILCPQVAGCPNSLASTMFMVIWGTRLPVLQEPVLAGMSWPATGGGGDDVSSLNRYAGRETVRVPAFPAGVVAARVDSDLTQGGAIGDPYGSGGRSVWWVWGVGPVRVEIRHAAGELQRAELVSTNLRPRPAPSDANYFPLSPNARMDFRWRNSRHMRAWSKQRFSVAQVANSSARVDVKSLSGPIRVAGSYVFSHELAGVTTIAAATRAASRAAFPGLGPRSAPASRRRHFFTAFDLMLFGFNPILTAYPVPGQRWSSTRGGWDDRVFGVTGRSRVAGTRTVSTPAGRFKALLVVSTLVQPGFKFGSGRRASYFAPGRGLVKLVFHHRDGSVSTVERTR